LTSVTVPESVVSIGFRAFAECSGLNYINVSDDNMNYSSIDGLLFDKEGTVMIQCPGARTSVTLPESVTSIGEESFRNCSKLEYVVIPKSVTSVGTRAFENCGTLTHVCYLGTNDPGKSDEHVFDGCNLLDEVVVVSGYEDEEFCEKPIKKRTNVYVVLEMDEGVKDMDLEQLYKELDMLPDNVSVKVERNDNYDIVRLLLFVDDEETANNIVSTIEEKREEGLFSKVKTINVIVKERSLSGASTSHDMLKSIVFILFLTIMIEMRCKC